MQKDKGKIIVIDGTDGSGKTTQLHLLKEKLEADGLCVEIADFPQYNHKSAGMVEEYLSGKYGGVDEVTPYQASIFYSVDRFDFSKQIKDWLSEGKIILCNRYTSSNMAHQGCKIENPLERKVFFNWLAELEHEILNIPRPDLCLILRVEAEISQKMAKERKREDWVGKTKDIHEDNLDHLKKAEKVYCEIAENNATYRLVNCTNDGKIMDPDEIALLVWIYVSQMIKAENMTKKDSFTALSDIITKNHRQAFNLAINENKKNIIKESLEEDSINPEKARAVSSEELENNNPTKEEELKKDIEDIKNSEEKENTEKKNNIIEDKKININADALLVEKIHPDAKIPLKSHSNDAGYDLFSIDNYSIPPYSQTKISTGIKLSIPRGHVGLIWDKSGLASQGLKTMGGVIDSGYRGEIIVIVKNLSEDFFHITKGQKIAQILIQEIGQIEILETKIEDETERNINGFGSTGKF